jgi:hypothetical protein
MTILISILTIIIIIKYNHPKYINDGNNNSIEGYYDITPYDFHWNMFKCLDMECLKDKSLKCYNHCNHWGESGGRHNCRLRCLDYADQYASQLKLNNILWNRILPKFKY